MSNQIVQNENLIKNKELEKNTTIFLKESVSSMIINEGWLILGYFSMIKLIKIYGWGHLTVKIHSNLIKSLELYKTFLISGSFKIVKIIDLEDEFKEIKTLELHENFINCLIVFKEMLISGSEDNSIIITNLSKNYETIKKLENFYNPISSINIFNNVLISGSKKLVRINNLENFDEIKLIDDFEDYFVKNIIIYNDKIHLSINNKIKILDSLDSYNEIKNLEVHSEEINSIILYDKYLISSSFDKNIKMISLLNDYSVEKNFIVKEEVPNILISIDDWLFFSSNDIKSIKKLELKEFKEIKQIEIHFNTSINDLIVYNNFLIISFNDFIQIYDINKNFELIKKLNEEHRSSVLIINNDWLFIGIEKDIIIWDLNDDFNRFKYLKDVQIYIIKNLIIHNKSLISSSINIIKINDLKNFENIKTLEIHDSDINCLEIFGDWLISGSSDEKIKITNLIDYGEVKVLDIHSFQIKCFIIKTNLWISGSMDKTIKITDLKKKFSWVDTLEIHDKTVTTLNTYKNFLISGSEDQTINITDLENNFYLVKTLRIHNHYIYFLWICNNNLISYAPNETKLTNLNNEINLEKSFNINKKSNENSILYNDWLIYNLNGDIKIVDLKNNYNEIEYLYSVHRISIFCIIIYNDWIISSNKNIVVIDIKNNFKEIELLKNFHGGHQIYSLVVYKDLLFSASDVIKINNIKNDFEKVEILYEIHNDYIYCMVIYKNYLISGSKDNTIKITDLENKYEIIKNIKIHTNTVTNILIYKNKYLISSSYDSTIKIIDLDLNKNNKYKIIKNLSNIHTNFIKCIKLYKDLLISACHDKTIAITDLSNNFQTIKQFKKYFNSPSNCCIDSITIYKEFLIAISSYDKIKILNIKEYNLNISINELLYFYYNKITNNKINEINILSIYNLLNINDDNKYILSIISNNYFKINYHIIKYTDDYKLLEESLKYFQYDRLYYYFFKNQNLIELIIRENKIKIYLKTIINYLKDNEIYYEINYKNFIKIFNCIKNDNEWFEWLFSYVFKESILDKKNFDQFVHLNNYHFLKSNEIILNSELFNNKFRKINNKNINKVEYDIYNFTFKIYNKLSKNKEFFNILENSNKEIKWSDLKYFINYFFDKILIFKIFNLLMFILLIVSLILSLNSYNFITILLYLISISYFTLYEIIQIILNLKSYFNNLLNLFDIGLLIFNFIIFFQIFTEKYRNINLIIMFLFYFNGLKLLNFLKSIDFIRKQIRLFKKVLTNTIEFIIFIFLILFYLSSINFLYTERNSRNFGISSFNIYGMMLGTYDDNLNDYKIYNFIELLLNTYFFNIILLNLFISVVGDIFNDYNENKELYNIEEKISLLVEYSSTYFIIEKIKYLYYKILYKIINNLKDKNLKLKDKEENYLFLILKKKDEHEISNENISNDLFNLKKYIKKNNNKVKNNLNDLKAEIENNNNNINDLKVEINEIKNLIINISKK